MIGCILYLLAYLSCFRHSTMYYQVFTVIISIISPSKCFDVLKNPLCVGRESGILQEQKFLFCLHAFACTVLCIHCPFALTLHFLYTVHYAYIALCLYRPSLTRLHSPLFTQSFPYTILSLHNPFLTQSFHYTIISLHSPFLSQSLP